MLNAAYKDTLFIVSDEMRVTLKDIKAALELAIDTQNNKHLIMVRELMHSAQGALEVIDFRASAMLAREMNKVIDQLIERKSSDNDLALQAISAGVVFLPSFFNKTVEAEGKEHSIALLPILQELRAARSEKPLSEDTLFLLDVKNDTLSDKTIQMPILQTQQDLRALIHKYRSIFQTSLLGWIKDKDSTKHLTRLAVITEKFEQAAKEERAFKLWWVTGGLVEALIEGGLKSSPDMRRLFGQVDRGGKTILDKGEKYFQENTDRTLINQLLYFIGRSSTTGKRVTEIRNAFSLSENLQIENKINEAKAAMATPDTEVMQSLAKAIKEDLERVKDTLDIFNRTGSKENLHIEDRFESLKKIADTLNMLGLIDLEKRVLEQQQEITSLLSRNENLTDSHMITVAASLLQVESRLEEELDKLAGKKGKDKPKFLLDALQATFRESKVNLARVKEVISQFMRDPTDIKPISRAPALLKEAQAACLLTGKERLAVILERLQDYITRYLIGSGRLPYGEHLELLAGAIESVDFYLETLNKGRRDPWYMLDNADSCLDQLVREAPKPLPQHGSDNADIEKTVAIPTLSAAQVSDLSQNIANKTVAIPRLSAEDIARMQKQGSSNTDEHPDAYPVMDESLQTDPEVIEIFIEEAKEVIGDIKSEFAAWLADNSQREALKSVRRGYHTLKGSGRMVGAKRLGEFAWSVENLINRTLEGTIKLNNDGKHLMQRAISVIPSLIEQLESGADTKEDVHQLMLSVESYTEQKLRDQVMQGDVTHHPSQMAKLQQSTPELDSTSNSPQVGSNDDQSNEAKPHTQIIDMREMMLNDGFNPNANASQHTQIMDMRDIVNSKDDSDIENILGSDQKPEETTVKQSDPVAYELQKPLYEIYMDETSKHLTVVKEFCRDSVGKPISNSMHRAAHTLHGTANMANLHPINALSAEFERFIQRLYDEGLPFEPNAAETVKQAVQTIEEMVATINTNQVMPYAPESLFNEFDALRLKVDTDIQSSALEDDGVDLDFSVLDDVITVESEARSETQRFTDSIAESQQVETFDTSGLTSNDLADEEPLATANDSNPNVDLNLDVGSYDASSEVTEKTDQALDSLEIELDDMFIVADSEPEPTQSVYDAQYAAPTLIAVDSEITNIFLEEAEEIIAQTDSAVSAWDDSGLSEESNGELQRYLHTLKGGARMAGLLSIGDFTHEIESYVIALRNNDLSKSNSAKRGLQSAVDHMHTMLADVKNGQPPSAAPEVLDNLQAIIEGRDVAVASAQTADESTSTVAPIVSDVSDLTDLDVDIEFTDESIQEFLEATGSHSINIEEAELETQTQTQIYDDTYAEEPLLEGELESVDLQEISSEQADEQKSNQTQIESDSDIDSIFEYAPQVIPVQQRQQDAARITTDNLETLLNQAGEISIFRSRIEQELSNANLNLAELARTVQRLREQLRKMEIETEATILYQHRDETEHSDFDPLEMDRYSNVQQVSRALAESVNDLQSLESLLENQFRETESLLLQQSRVMTDLQDSLMRVRMIPFAKYAPRYARIVRQIASETGKEVELNVVGADSEIDRQVIERMQAPLEHMIRNAVIHGIEMPAGRAKANKDPEGSIELRLSREGAQLLMEMEDDGTGLDLKAIHAKAIEQGLLSDDQEVSDADLANMILNSGFSTASEVTQNAGRGVGMDVVASEIKQLGGSLQITTEAGKGTRFLMRLPYTRAINHALLVRSGEENYAIPIHKVDGVAKMSLRELQALLDSDEPVYEYAGRKYDVKTLGQIVGAPNVGLDLDEPQHSIIMVTGGDHHAALVINELIGSREMVIKPVGPQIAGISGISGATILGDGRIVVILDMDALLGVRLQDIHATDTVKPQALQPLILVVDDSITVRRVTERLLERNKMDVITARDGLDALSVLQEQTPDLILMDIEMPRMDGYELAEHVRKDNRIKDIPIIMITSRTGDKHRKRAMLIGVDDYLGKPYREDQLLESIQPHLQQFRA